jgi:hypothetical protein
VRDRDGGRARPDRERDRPPPPRPRPDDHPAAASRARSADQAGRLDRVRDAAQIRARVDRLRTMEQDHPDWGHTYREHVQATDEQLALRAKSGINARGRPGRVPEHATRWQSAESMAIAADGLRNSAEFRRSQDAAVAGGDPQFTVRRPLADVLGPGWRSDVYGRSRASGGTQPSRWRPDGNACAVWRRQDDGRWHLYTCYPEPTNHGLLGG